MKKFFLSMILLPFLLVFTACAAEQAPDSGMPPPPPPGMADGKSPMRQIPQEAIAACKGKAEGVSCTAGRGGAGTCSYTPDKKFFACKPKHRGPRPEGPPPSE